MYERNETGPPPEVKDVNVGEVEQHSRNDSTSWNGKSIASQTD